MIDRKDPLPVTAQCRILDLSRSGVYYTPAPLSVRDRELMRAIDEIHLDMPHLGSRGMRNELGSRGYKAGRIHVRTLMRKMGEPGGRCQETKKADFPNTLPVISSGYARVVSSSTRGFWGSNGPQFSSEEVIYTGNRPEMSARGESPWANRQQQRCSCHDTPALMRQVCSTM
ncbi:MAG: hypothetical protein PHC90_04250 [Syntrophorhabdaceae bacterium]|nr:hypothetical protein [Syntrophorhabdaceae bacterium]